MNIKIPFYYVIVLLAYFIIWCHPQNGLAQDQINNFKYYLCKGDTLIPQSPPDPPPTLIPQIIPTPPQPPPPPGAEPPFDEFNPDQIIWIPTPCYFSETRVQPDENWENNAFFPETTTTYKVTYLADFCDYTSVSYIQVYVLCDAKNNPINQRYPWLAKLTNTDVCGFSSIEVYEKNGLYYVNINNEDGKILYFQDGSVLCKNEPNYNCLEAYQLTNKVQSWSCDQPSTDNPVDEPVNVFNTYPFLTTFVDPSDCTGKSVYVYDADGYEFIIVKTDLAEILLTTEGKVYCMIPTGGFSFLRFYDSSRIVDSWFCDTGFQGRASFSETKNQGIQIFPNPATDKLFINLQVLAFEQPIISIYDVHGKPIKQLTSAAAFAGIVQLDVGDLEQGIYLVEARTSENSLTEKLLIK